MNEVPRCAHIKNWIHIDAKLEGVPLGVEESWGLPSLVTVSNCQLWNGMTNREAKGENDRFRGKKCNDWSEWPLDSAFAIDMRAWVLRLTIHTKRWGVCTPRMYIWEVLSLAKLARHKWLHSTMLRCSRSCQAINACALRVLNLMSFDNQWSMLGQASAW